MTRTSRGHGTLPQASSLGGVTKTWPGHSRDRGDITSQDRIRLRHDQTWPNDMEDSWPGSYLQKSRRADWHMTGTWPEKLTCITCDIHWLYISGLVKSAGNSFHRCPDVCQRRAIRAVPLVVHQRPQEIWQTTQQRIQLLLDSVLANYLDRWMQQPEHTARIRSQTHNLVSSWDQRNIWYALEQCCGSTARIKKGSSTVKLCWNLKDQQCTFRWPLQLHKHLLLQLVLELFLWETAEDWAWALVNCNSDRKRGGNAETWLLDLSQKVFFRLWIKKMTYQVVK